MNINAGGLFFKSTARIVAAQSEVRALEHSQRDIYESHRHRVFSLAFYMTGNELEAEQLLTDTFMHAFRILSEPDARTVDDALIAGLRSRFTLLPAAPASISADGLIQSGNARRTDLEEAIQQLPALERLAFLLRDVEGYSPESISQLLEMPQPEITRTLFSARIRLRGILAAQAKERAA